MIIITCYSIIFFAFSSSFSVICAANAFGSYDILTISCPSLATALGSLIMISKLFVISSHMEGSIIPSLEASEAISFNASVGIASAIVS